MHVVDGLSSPTYLEPHLDHPLYMEAVDQALGLCDEGSGPVHVKLVLEWTSQAKEQVISDDSEKVEEHVSVQELKSNPPDTTAVTLRKCFELYTHAEKLGPEDAWYCPFCNRKQEVVKKLGLWSLPDILVIHLKRFRQSSKQRATTKLTTMVEFPLEGFDMSPHVANRTAQSSAHMNGTTVSLAGTNWSPWKRPKSHTLRQDDYVYDLYAVCNHHGKDLQGGHYTAVCKNPYDGEWYCFDDTKVSQTDSSEIKTCAAYILFYQRRSLALGPQVNCSNEHWVNRMPVFHYKPPKSSKSQENLAMRVGAENEAELAFRRGDHKYATLQPVKKPASVADELDRFSDDDTSIMDCLTREVVPEADISDVAVDIAPDVKETEEGDSEKEEVKSAKSGCSSTSATHRPPTMAESSV